MAEKSETIFSGDRSPLAATALLHQGLPGGDPFPSSAPDHRIRPRNVDTAQTKRAFELGAASLYLIPVIPGWGWGDRGLAGELIHPRHQVGGVF